MLLLIMDAGSYNIHVLHGVSVSYSVEEEVGDLLTSVHRVSPI